MQPDEQPARTQVVFRSANEAILRNTAGRSYTLTFLCECADQRCMTRVELTARQYEDVRSDPCGFALTSGHEAADDVIVARFERFTVVRKIGAAAHVVRAFDPRDGG